MILRIRWSMDMESFRGGQETCANKLLDLKLGGETIFDSSSRLLKTRSFTADLGSPLDLVSAPGDKSTPRFFFRRKKNLSYASQRGSNGSIST